MGRMRAPVITNMAGVIFGYTIFINERNYDIHALVSYDVKAPKILALLSNPDEI
mgnify:CR=1 FL=1